MTSPAAVKASNPVHEYSIFVGDLAPEASNSDLLAVFRNPILGLRSDRAPKVVKPFYSAKSAKIMLDPVTGVSKGYGFVRFTDQAEQQRALMEMHGLYCLSRPMRVSPATAKFKPASPVPAPAALPTAFPTHAFPAAFPGSNSFMSSVPSLTSSESHSFNASLDSIPTPNRSASAFLAAGERRSYPQQPQAEPRSDLSFLPQLTSNQSSAAFEESWNSPANAQARAILANLTGPNGEQLSSADPYNTTVFVGGLSPLISEETLRTFFAPFGDIHYVKVPVGKHCGFVQFVRKADAQRAIDRMQGFPICGSRIRLSWGRSQYKAAQSVVQQAQVQAQLQAQQTQIQQQQQQQQQPNPTQYSSQPHVASNQTTPKNLNPSIASQITLEQALDLLSRYGYQGVAPPNAQSTVEHIHSHGPLSPQSAGSYGLGVQSVLNHTWRLNTMDSLPHTEPQQQQQQQGHGCFSPFEQRSPPMNDSSMLSQSQTQLFNRAPGFGPSLSLPSDLKLSHHHRSKEIQSNASGSPRSASTHTVFSNGDGGYHQFFDGGRSGYHLNVADILRKDSQALPRSYSNSSPRGDGEVPMKYSHSTSLAGMKSGDIRDINGMLMNLSLDLHDGARKDELDTTTAAEIWQSKESTPSPRPGEA